MCARKIYINGKFLIQQESGVQAYAKGLLNEMASRKIEFEVLSPKLAPLSDVFKVKRIGKFSNSFLWEQLSLARFIKQEKDAILINFCNSASLFISNQIVTIHDLAFEKKNVKWFSIWFKLWYRFLIPRICHRAKLIFTVSEFSKKELCSCYDINPNKIKVIPNGIEICKEVSERLISDDYVLIVGANNPRKNAISIINQIDELKKRNLKLVVLHQSNKVFKEEHLVENPDVIYLNNVSKKDYDSLIKHSKALIYPSLYEGFGIPILESLCLKIPVICSDLEVFRESFGNLPIYFNLSTLSEFPKALDKIDSISISDDDVDKLKSQFSFSKSVSLILNSLEEI